MISIRQALIALILPLGCIPIAAARVPNPVGPHWIQRPAYPLPVFEAAGAVLRPENRSRFLVVAGGYISDSGLRPTNAVYALPLRRPNPVWRKLAPMPMPLTHCAQAAVADALYVCGGFAGLAPGRAARECFVYRLSSDTWLPLPPLPIAVGGGGMVYIPQNNALFYASGMQRANNSYRGSDSGATFMLELSDLPKGWVRRAPMPNPRNHMAAMTAGGRHFFFGGQHRNDEDKGNQRTMNEYQWMNDKWVARAPIPEPLGHISASSLSYWSGILVVAGITNGRTLSNKIWYYDALTNQWHWVGLFPRKVQSPVCGQMHKWLTCATGQGTPGSSNTVFSRQFTPPALV